MTPDLERLISTEICDNDLACCCDVVEGKPNQTLQTTNIGDDIERAVLNIELSCEYLVVLFVVK